MRLPNCRSENSSLRQKRYFANNIGVVYLFMWNKF